MSLFLGAECESLRQCVDGLRVAWEKSRPQTEQHSRDKLKREIHRQTEIFRRGQKLRLHHHGRRRERYLRPLRRSAKSRHQQRTRALLQAKLRCNQIFLQSDVLFRQVQGKQEGSRTYYPRRWAGHAIALYVIVELSTYLFIFVFLISIFYGFSGKACCAQAGSLCL